MRYSPGPKIVGAGELRDRALRDELLGDLAFPSEREKAQADHVGVIVLEIVRLLDTRDALVVLPDDDGDLAAILGGLVGGEVLDNAA